MRDQSNIILIQANEKSKEVIMKQKQGHEDSYEYEEESYYEEDGENQENQSQRSAQKNASIYESNEKRAR